MVKRMLIDAAYEDEQRIVVLDNEALVEAEFHSATKTQIKGNFYLARVTRVEPSLQAAFVEFGQAKHGFLPFSEIHPDYFQIPLADREALLEEVQNALNERQPLAGGKAETADADTVANPTTDKPSQASADEQAPALQEVPLAEETPPQDQLDDASRESQAGKTLSASIPNEVMKAATVAGDIPDQASDSRSETTPETPPETAPEIVSELVSEMAPEPNPEAQDQDATATQPKSRSRRRGTRNGEHERKPSARAPRRQEDDLDDLSDAEFESRTMARVIMAKKYKIQEVIKRNQVILVQVAKDERGDKGAALTTYLSLPGRYCVLMPNTHRSGGISRRISDSSDRKRLKTVLEELDLAPSMSLIVRTAGAERTKQEVKRDFAYLSRTWDEIRQTTLNSFAPALVYEEANLIKRAIRDIYENDTQEVLVAGEGAYKAAKAFMKTLTPSHAARVKHYRHETPLFQAYGVEGMLESLNRPQVRLPSGGYLVINQTEALVAVDVNSGKATREKNIEETALRSNLEAARETARQLRLRDMAGLIVIDFIDMEDQKNIAAVERTLKDALKPDRARLQVGRISQFGLMELSRQRLRPSVVEATMAPCQTCHGTGYVKSNPTNARGIIRQIEQALAKDIADEVRITAGQELAMTLANDQRANMTRLETTYQVVIEIAIDPKIGPSHYNCELSRMGKIESFASDPMTSAETSPSRRRGKRGGRDLGEPKSPVSAPSQTNAQAGEQAETDEDGDRKRRRRGKRGGRRRGGRQESEAGTQDIQGQERALDPSEVEQPALTDTLPAGSSPAAPAETAPTARSSKPKSSRQRRQQATTSNPARSQSTSVPAADPLAAPHNPERRILESTADQPETATPNPASKRRGWWSRVRGG